MEFMSDTWYWLCCHTFGQCGCRSSNVRSLVLLVVPHRGLMLSICQISLVGVDTISSYRGA